MSYANMNAVSNPNAMTEKATARSRNLRNAGFSMASQVMPSANTHSMMTP